MLIENIRPSRRAFLAGSAGLVIGFYLAPLGRAARRSPITEACRPTRTGTQFAPNAFVRIAPDDTVTVLCKHTEMGQGPYTGLTTIVAEELDADWSQMRAAASPANDELYKNLAFGVHGHRRLDRDRQQLRAVRRPAPRRAPCSSPPPRRNGACPAARSRSRRAASATRRRAARAASARSPRRRPRSMLLPAEPTLKDPKNFRLIGTDIRRLDTAAKSNGTAIFTIDISAAGHADRAGRASGRSSAPR